MLLPWSCRKQRCCQITKPQDVSFQRAAQFNSPNICWTDAQLFAGHTHSCLLDRHTAVCWTDTQLFAGQTHSCLLDIHTAVCWTYTQLFAWQTHSCLLDRHSCLLDRHTAVCWTDTQLFAGQTHSCFPLHFDVLSWKYRIKIKITKCLSGLGQQPAWHRRLQFVSVWQRV
jgi:hypothetical protein